MSILSNLVISLCKEGEGLAAVMSWDTLCAPLKRCVCEHAREQERSETAFSSKPAGCSDNIEKGIITARGPVAD